MEDLRPDEELEAKEFEEATKSRWSKPQFPQLPNRPKLPKRPNLRTLRNKWFIGFVILLIVLFGGRWLNHVLRNDNKTPAAPTTAQPVAANQPKATSTAPTTTPAPTSSQTPSQVPDTGPGDTLAIFLVVTGIAAGLHYVSYGSKTRS